MPNEHIPGGYAVVGAGRLGCVLAQALVASGRSVALVYSRSGASALALAQRLPAARVASNLAEVPVHAGTVFVTVPDGEIEQVARTLPITPEHGVVHCSGASDLGVLRSCAERGAAVGCFHPLQAFPSTQAGAERLTGIAIGVEATGYLARELSDLVAALGSRSLSLAGVDRAGYHAAAVFASNYLVALFAAAERVWHAAGLPADAARTALSPLTAGALSALSEAPLPQALTGPIARGDLETVRAQLRALERDPPRRALYQALGRELLTLDRPEDAGRHAALAQLLADD